MRIYKYDNFPTMEEIKRDYNELMNMIKGVRTIEQAKEMENKGFIVEINGLPIEEFVNEMESCYGESINEYEINNMIEWIRYEAYGCLSYIYDRFDGKPMFDVWSEYCYDEFIRDITIDDLTEELYNNAIEESL